MRELPRAVSLSYHGLALATTSVKNRLIRPKSSVKKIVIVVGGGPAPGIPNAIRSIALEAIRNGIKVYQAQEGINGLIDNNLFELTFDDVWNLKHSKRNPGKTSRQIPNTPDKIDKVKATLKRHGIDKIITIGGDDTAYVAKLLSLEGYTVASLTKTIDDDVLPYQYIDHTFGWDTAAEVIGNEINSLVHGAWALPTWFIVRSMGRASGSLALEAARRGGAHICLIPEQFKNSQLTIKALQDEAKRQMQARVDLGFNYGVVVVSEGFEIPLAQEITKASETQIVHDNNGNICQGQLFRQCHKLIYDGFPGGKLEGIKIELKEFGYEVRTEKPSNTDIRSTTMQGQAAVQLLLDGKESALIAVRDNKIVRVPYSTPGIFDPNTGKLIKREVDTNSLQYQAAKREIDTKFLRP